MASETTKLIGFHGAKDSHEAGTNTTLTQQTTFTTFTYTFENFFHPYVSQLIEQLNKKSLRGLFDPTFHASLEKKFFESSYHVSNKVKTISFPKEIDVREGGPYANYNWELLFHVPLTIAVHLSKNQRFDEAQRWFHFIFDPTCNDTSIDPPLRYWKFLPFRKKSDVTKIDELLKLLSKNILAPDERIARDFILDGYNALLKKPFQPHAVARTRHLSYQYNVIMKYLDNLIAWGDHLFRQDTIESINEATQRYVLASNILGARPQRIPHKGSIRYRTFAELKERGLDELGNTLVELEGKFPFNTDLPQSGSDDTKDSLFGIGRTLYFCVPRNEKMLRYWDTVADRLFKIRNCMNIEGAVRQLALFDPPLDPAMLVKAASAGINIGSIVNGTYQPIGPIRSLFLIQKALELTSEVRNLGSALLSAIEKEDGERLTLLRQNHEIAIQQMSQEVRFLQWKQAEESTKSLLGSRINVLERYNYYRSLIGLPPDNDVVPAILTVEEREEFSEENFDSVYSTLVEKYEKEIPRMSYPVLKLAEDPSISFRAGQTGPVIKNKTKGEDNDLNVHGPEATNYRNNAVDNEITTQILSLIPDFGMDLHFWGLGGHLKLFGGFMFSTRGAIKASELGFRAAEEEKAGIDEIKTDGYDIRSYERILQANLAASELMQIGRQITGSLIAEQMAKKEFQNIKTQISYSQEIDQILESKFTNEKLYIWMQGELTRLYYEYYRFAFDTACRAEQTMKQELMRPEFDERDFIKFNYWDSGRKGLLSGEALYLDCKRLEIAYYENNKREYELTKYVSMRQLNPFSLLTLKTTGSCELTIPEWFFDMDCPGHYLRRLKNVSVTIPCVIGPYTSVNCTLTLLKSTTRKSALLTNDEYIRENSEDERFIDYFSVIQSIVTSSSNNDSGMFETNLRDDRFLPFEGYGAISTWKIELPAEFRQFDYDTISDIVMQIRYTARQGGTLLKEKSISHLNELISQANKSGLALLFNLKHDFSMEWHEFVNGALNFSAIIKRDHFSYISHSRNIRITEISIHLLTDESINSILPVNIDASVLEAFSNALNDTSSNEFNLFFNESNQGLVREAKANVFVLIKYTLETR